MPYRHVNNWLFIAGGEKVAPPSTELRTCSIIRATCAFDTKKVLEYRFVILVTLFGKVSYKFFKKFDFCSKVSAFLIEN